jgi:acetyltransferase-like isoleucine patch superfamily enzyme
MYVLGDGAVVGAGSIVTRSVPSHELWAGVPAKFIRRLKNSDDL